MTNITLHPRISHLSELAGENVFQNGDDIKSFIFKLQLYDLVN